MNAEGQIMKQQLQAHMAVIRHISIKNNKVPDTHIPNLATQSDCWAVYTMTHATAQLPYRLYLYQCAVHSIHADQVIHGVLQYSFLTAAIITLCMQYYQFPTPG